MGAVIGFEKRVIYTSNSEWDDVVDNVIVVAKQVAKDESQNGFIEGLEEERRGFYSGYCPNFDRLFLTRVEKIFWASCFFEVARWLSIGKLPHEEARSPARRIFIAYWCGEVLRHLIHREAGEFVFLTMILNCSCRCTMVEWMRRLVKSLDKMNGRCALMRLISAAY